MSIKLLLEMNHLIRTDTLSRLEQRILCTNGLVARTHNEHIVSVKLPFPELFQFYLSSVGT